MSRIRPPSRRCAIFATPAIAGVTSCRHRLLRHRRFQIGDDRLEELLGRHPRLLRADEDGQVFGHLAAFDRLYAHALEGLRESRDLWRIVELAAVLEPAGPRED